MSFLLAAALWAASARIGVVVKPVANMYSKPTEDADVVSQAIYGTNVDFLEDSGAWIKVRTPDEYTGWMPLSSLRPIKPGERPYATKGLVAQVENLFAYLYQEPDVTRRRPMLTAPFETRLEVVAEPKEDERRWLQVRLPDERTGWLQRGDLSLKPERLSIEAVIALAKRFLGLPYLWGGTSSFGYDCSGFTQMLCRRRGTIIPRDTGPQAHWAGFAPVERSALEPGDLLYFGKSLQKITHSGMYIGNGEFIHASTHGRPVVQISRLKEQPWTGLLVCARRLK